MEELLELTFQDTGVWIKNNDTYTLLLGEVRASDDLLRRFELAGVAIALSFVWLRKAPIELNPFMFFLIVFGPDAPLTEEFANSFPFSVSAVLKYLPTSPAGAKEALRDNEDLAELIYEVFQRNVSQTTPTVLWF